MGVGLQPLEFTDCLADSPQFRENLQRHEKELERTSQQIKRLIKEVKDVVNAARRLGSAQLALATSMEQLEFTCLGASMTEDERVISKSLHHCAALIRTIEDERDRMLNRANEQIIQPLENFRKEHIGAVKEGKKKFEKKSAKLCQMQERTLALSPKRGEAALQEADAQLEMMERDFCAASLDYVRRLHALHERKKYELVETMLGFVFGWWTFHHTAHDVHHDAEPLVRDLQLRIQRTRNNFEETSAQTETLMKKMMEIRHANKESEAELEDAEEDGITKAGYLYLMEKKAFGTTTWNKHYVTYRRRSRTLTMVAYTQLAAKNIGVPESFEVSSCREVSESEFERRWVWEAAGGGEARGRAVLQAANRASRAGWIRAISGAASGAGTGPTWLRAQDGPCLGRSEPEERGSWLVECLVRELESRGLREPGLYRAAGVASRVTRLLAATRPPRDLHDPLVYDTKVLCSAIKTYLRNLPEPLLTTRLHHKFIDAAKLETRGGRVSAIAALVRMLPPNNRRLLQLVMAHLTRVVAESSHNLMSASNLAVCFGPTLLRAERETVASILEIKFYNVVVETMLDHYHEVFNDSSEYVPHQAACLQYAAPLSAPLSAPLNAPLMPPPPLTYPATRVRTLYACVAESEGELSFEPNQVITNVTHSGEPGWLRGELRGCQGLVPQNYVEPLP